MYIFKSVNNKKRRKSCFDTVLFVFLCLSKRNLFWQKLNHIALMLPCDL